MAKKPRAPKQDGASRSKRAVSVDGDVTIGQLRDHLSAYLRQVRRGQEIVILDRDTPIARIVPHVAPQGSESELEALVAAGVLREPEGPHDPDALDRLPVPRLRRGVSVLEALLADREESR